jgi:hypothetical protein
MILVEPDPNSGNIYTNAKEYKGPVEFQGNMNTHIFKYNRYSELNIEALSAR